MQHGLDALEAFAQAALEVLVVDAVKACVRLGSAGERLLLHGFPNASFERKLRAHVETD